MAQLENVMYPITLLCLDTHWHPHDSTHHKAARSPVCPSPLNTALGSGGHGCHLIHLCGPGTVPGTVGVG